MKTILFQGDSITDASRDRTNPVNNGCGYVTMIAGALGADGEDYKVINRGTAGVGIASLVSTVPSDFLNLKPDYLSILIGVNDALYEAREREKRCVSVNKFEALYSLLIEEVKEELPNIKIILMSPFVYKGSATEDNFELLSREVRKLEACVKALSEKYNLSFICLREEFDKVKSIDITYDGVHPTAAGHEIIKRAWLKKFNEIKE